MLPVALALCIVFVPLSIAFVATAVMLWRGGVWRANSGRTGTVRNLLAIAAVVLINGALAVQALFGLMTLQVDTSRVVAGLAGLIVCTACAGMVRRSWAERWPVRLP